MKALCGGLRTAELRELNFECIVKNGDVYDVELIRKKQKGEKKTSTLIVPLSLAEHLTNYFVAVTAALGEENRTGHLIKGTPVSKSKPNTCRLANQPMGVNTLYSIGKDMAIKLGRENPETYIAIASVEWRQLWQRTGVQPHNNYNVRLGGRASAPLKDMLRKVKVECRRWHLF